MPVLVTDLRYLKLCSASTC